MAWLKLCNFARELKRIWKIENDRSNKVYVWCDPHYKDEMIDFLTGIVYFHKDGKPIPIGKVLNTWISIAPITNFFCCFRIVFSSVNDFFHVLVLLFNKKSLVSQSNLK